MKSFAQLYRQLDQTNSVTKKVILLKNYLDAASESDKLWLVALFTGRRLKGILSVSRLREYAIGHSGISDWLFEECYATVGDLAETIALVLQSPVSGTSMGLSDTIVLLQEMTKMDEERKREKLFDVWNSLETFDRFVFNKLLTGGFRIGVSQKLMSKALALHTGIDEKVIAHRLMGDWSPLKVTFEELLFAEKPEDADARPYPFCLAHPLENEIESLGETSDWLVEYKWDGIRGQIIYRGKQVYIWSRGEELVTDRFPELKSALANFPDGIVLDGEIMAMKDGHPLPFLQLQTRINRKSVGKKLLEDVPVVFVAYDLLEHRAVDLRSQPLSIRRAKLEEVVRETAHSHVFLSERLEFDSWAHLVELRNTAIAKGSEGVMLKRKSSVYETGRKTGSWWKWKADPLTIDAVMIYAQAGHGRRAGMFTDYTFALWHGDRLVPIAKAYSGLTDAEIRLVDAFVKKNTREKFGPVRSVLPALVFELGFEAVNQSARHKSGVAVRFPRILRWRTDKVANEANTLDDLKRLIR